jgi:glycosyltransferase involved in cell wall biosynthesis
MRIALVAPPMISIPPHGYAGTERVVAALGEELHRRGHAVTLFAAGDSSVPYELVPTVPVALWGAGRDFDATDWVDGTIDVVANDAARFDVVHSHLGVAGLPLMDRCAVPVISTLHGRLDVDTKPACLAAYRDAPLVAISASQRRWFPANNWVATIHHGLPFAPPPPREAADHLVLVGRATREKGITEAIRVARLAGRRLVIAAKAKDPKELRFVDEVIRPALGDGAVEFVGEVPAAERDELMAGAFATLMLGAWPEPFGLVAVESMALGTPVVARRAGALPELIEHGVDGFLVDDIDEALFALQLVPELDRRRIQERALERFSVRRMVDAYLDAYRALVSGSAPASRPWTDRRSDARCP